MKKNQSPPGYLTENSGRMHDCFQSNVKTGLVTAEVRFRVDPADLPPEKAARRLHLSLQRFNELLPRLLARGFPPPDQDTGYFALEAIDQWRKLRTPALFGLTPATPTDQSVPVDVGSLGERFAAKKRRGQV